MSDNPTRLRVHCAALGPRGEDLARPLGADVRHTSCGLGKRTQDCEGRTRRASMHHARVTRPSSLGSRAAAAIALYQVTSSGTDRKRRRCLSAVATAMHLRQVVQSPSAIGSKRYVSNSRKNKLFCISRRHTSITRNLDQQNQ